MDIVDPDQIEVAAFGKFRHIAIEQDDAQPCLFAAETNQLILDRCKKAGLRIVLLDRDVTEFPERSNLDLVGIDNVHAAFLLTNHLLDQGCQSVIFLSRPGSASTIKFRTQGFQSALVQRKIFPEQHMIQTVAPGDKDAVATIMNRKPDGIVCANDATAAELLQTLDQLKVNVPGDVRLAGFDDVKYSRLLSPPLTTVRQPCARIAAVALDAMSMRLEKPGLPARSIRLNGELIVRESTVNSER